jgi:uncharacterized protein YkwD
MQIRINTFDSLSDFRFLRLKSWAVAGLSVLLLLAAPAVARETYVDYANRILVAAEDGAAVRPDLEAAVLRATNAYRASQGLPPLKPVKAKLLQAARAHAMDLLLHAEMGHTASTGHGFESRMRAFYPGQLMLPAMAENAARERKADVGDAAKAQRLVKQWIGSAGHRKNMRDRTYTSIAIGVVSRGDDVYAVQIFSGPVVKTNMFGNKAPSE